MGAKLKIDGTEDEADPGLAAAISAREIAQRLRIDALTSEVTTAGARVAKAEAEAALHKIRADKADKVDVRALVKRRLALERAPCVMILDMAEEVIEDMEDRDVMLAAIVAAIPGYSGEGKSDEVIMAVFEAVKGLTSVAGADEEDDGREALAGARQDSAPDGALRTLRAKHAVRGQYKKGA